MFKFHSAVAAAVLLISVSSLATAAVTPETEEQKTLYALGLMMSGNLGPFQLSAEEAELVAAGLRAGATGGETHGINPSEYQAKLQELAKARALAAAAKEKDAAKPFLEAEANKSGAVKTASGLIFSSLEEGDGESPKPTDKVKVHYKGTLRDGTVFDSSLDRGEPVVFGLNQVISCWTEGLQLMKVGGKAQLVCPSDIAYGDQGRPPAIPAGAVLLFEVQLLEIVEP